jgi:uncharacterized damage-inducible protein DinB
MIRRTGGSRMTNREFFLQHSKSEFPRFMNVFQAAPGGQLAYRPHPKSRSAEELIGHLIGHEQDLVELAETGKINHRMQVPFKSMDEALELYRSAHATLERALGSMDDKTWESNGQFIIEGNVIYEIPRRDLAWMLLFDGLHHRGQLSTYLRPMGGKVPSIYGPSADTAGG